jgi:hypothetical protein
MQGQRLHPTRNRGIQRQAVPLRAGLNHRGLQRQQPFFKRG